MVLAGLQIHTDLACSDYQNQTVGLLSIDYSRPMADLTLDLSPSRAGLHIEQCISSNHLCPPPRREHLPTSAPVLAGPALFLFLEIFYPEWIASPPRNPPPLSWLGTDADSARRF